MAEAILRDVGDYVEWALQKGSYGTMGRHFFFKAGDVSGLGGAINVTYGSIVYDQINREVNAHAIIKKMPWERSGFRVTTGDPTTKLYGGADPGTVGLVVDMTPTELKTNPAYLHTPWDVTLDAGFRAQHDDGLDIFDWKTQIMRDVHASGINVELLRSAEAEANTGGAVTDPKNQGAGKGLESLDRLISADAEEDDLGGGGSGWYDLYEGDIDRDTGTTFDSVIATPDGTNTNNAGNPTFGTNLAFQVDGIDALIDETENNGADPSAQVFLTGRDTRRAFYREVQTAGRFDLTSVQTKLDMTGLSVTATHPGRDITYTIRAYQDRPFVADKQTPNNGTTAPRGGTGKSHVFLLDQRNIYLRVGFPTLYVEADNPILRGQFDSKALYLTVEQLIATRFNTSGKLRSIAA